MKRIEVIIEKILDNEIPELAGYLVFRHNQVEKSDKKLYDGDGNVYEVLDFKEVLFEQTINDVCEYKTSWCDLVIKSCTYCVKLDKPVDYGTILYTSSN